MRATSTMVVVEAVAEAEAEAAAGAEDEDEAGAATGATDAREAVTGAGPRITLCRTAPTLQLATKVTTSDVAVLDPTSVPSRRRRFHQPLVSVILRVIPLPRIGNQRPAPMMTTNMDLVALAGASDLIRVRLTPLVIIFGLAPVRPQIMCRQVTPQARGGLELCALSKTAYQESVGVLRHLMDPSTIKC